jgi:hypothetical protein
MAMSRILAKACGEISRMDGAIVAWHEVPGTVMYVMRPALPLRKLEQSAARGSRGESGPRGRLAPGGVSSGEEVKRDALRTLAREIENPMS